MLVRADINARTVIFLKGHAGGMKANGRNGVPIFDGIKIVGRTVKELDLLPIHLCLYGSPIDVVYPVERAIRHLVVNGIGIWRKEVVTKAKLVRIDIKYRGILP